MPYKLSKELKTAISNLPESEKDKLLFRLLPKDEALCEKLEFELLEEDETLDDHREKIREKIEQTVKSHHYSPGWLMMDMRTINAEIGRHTKRTQDKTGEIELTLLLLNRALDEQWPYFEKQTSRSQNLAEYIAKRTQDVLAKIVKLHPDLHIEFEADVNNLLQRLHSSAAANCAVELQLPKQVNF